MVRAYVAIIAGEGTAADVADAVRALSGVDEAHVVAGDFDVVAEIEGEGVRDLQRTVTGGVHGLDGVGTTRTYVQLD